MAKFAPTVPRMTEKVFLVIGYDAPGSAPIRNAQLEAHLDYVEQRCNDYLVCGPLKPPGETELIGSYFLLAADSEADARAMVEGDPYVAHGVYQRIDVKEAVASAGRLMGGVIWESAEAIRAAQAATEETQ